MDIVTESAATLKGFIAKTSLYELARSIVFRRVLTLIMHRGRMSCSQAAGSIAKLKRLLAAALPAEYRTGA